MMRLELIEERLRELARVRNLDDVYVVVLEHPNDNNVTEAAGRNRVAARCRGALRLWNAAGVEILVRDSDEGVFFRKDVVVVFPQDGGIGAHLNLVDALESHKCILVCSV